VNAQQMETLKRRGLASEHMLDCLTLEEIGGMEGFGLSAVEEIKAARGLGAPKGVIDLTDPENFMDSILGEPDVEAPDDGLVELKLTLRIPARRLDWLQRLSKLGQEINPQLKERYSIEGLVIGFINDARRLDSTDAGRRTYQTSFKKG